MKSTRTRTSLANSLDFLDPRARIDILDAAKTNTFLISALALLRKDYGGTFLVTAVRSDHGDDSALGPHGHAGGYAADLRPALNSTNQINVQHMANCIAKNPFIWTVLFGGAYAWLLNTTTFPPQPPFVSGADNTQDHFHIQVANQNGGPGPR